MTISFVPIGVAHTPFRQKMEAPRQPEAARDVPGTLELYPGRGFEDALCDLSGWDRIWVLFVFDRAGGYRPKVLPPRSPGVRRGVFSTRSPHRPNPLGLSVLRLVSVDGLRLSVLDVDLLDQTPLLDIKPYVPYTDAHPGARTGWLEGQPLVEGERPDDPRPRYAVVFAERAREQLAFLLGHGIDLESAVTEVLALGPQPHAYRRIRKEANGSYRLAYKAFRLAFHVEGTGIVVDAVTSGYRPKELAEGTRDAPPELAVHQAFVARFGG